MRPLFIALLACLSLTAVAFDHTHATLDALLQAHVDDKGMIDYAAIKKDPDRLDAYLADLAAISKDQVESWNRQQQLAYWINAYNAYTIKAIVDHYPIKASGLSAIRFPDNSIRQIDGVWDKLTWEAGGEELTLNQMEHEKMRRDLREPRIHFAINCASIGCPVLPDRAFTANNLDKQLDKAAQAFINNPDKVKVTRRELALSKIFEWFGEDFERFDAIDGYGKYDGVVSFCLKHLPADKVKLIKAHKPDIEWLDYDWSLNEQK